MKKNNSDLLWKEIIKNSRKKFIMTCGSKDFNKNGSDHYNAEIGLASNHAYSLLSIKELMLVDGVYILNKKISGKKTVYF